LWVESLSPTKERLGGEELERLAVSGAPDTLSASLDSLRHLNSISSAICLQEGSGRWAPFCPCGTSSEAFTSLELIFGATNVVLTTIRVGGRLAYMSAERPDEPEGVIPFDSPSQRVFLHLWRTYDLLKAIENECLAAFGVSAQQYNVLRLLRASHPRDVPTMQLGRNLVTRGPDITRMLDRLSRRGWVQRTRPSDNRRRVDVRITDAGLKLLAEIDQAIIPMHERQLGHLSDEEKEQLIGLLRIVRRPHESHEGELKG